MENSEQLWPLTMIKLFLTSGFYSQLAINPKREKWQSQKLNLTNYAHNCFFVGSCVWRLCAWMCQLLSVYHMPGEKPFDRRVRKKKREKTTE